MRTRRRLAVGGAALVLLAACSGKDTAEPEPAPETAPTSTRAETQPETQPAPAPGPLRLRLAKVASGFESPVHVTAAPGEADTLYVVEQGGRIRRLEGGRLDPEPFLDLAGAVSCCGEQGLLSVAFHPDYEQNRLFYVDYTDEAGDTAVVEYRAVEGARPEVVRELLAVDQPYANHNGGQLAFGPDGLLYVGMGDGGAGGDPANRAQDLSSQLGKLLRLDVERRGAEWKIAAYGLRNPWRFSFDRETGDLWIGDVGQGEWEEIDHVPAGEDRLLNFGWDALEGSHVYEDKAPNPRGRLVGPVAEYSHSEGCSVTGGFVYRGANLPAARGRYFYGDYCSGTVWSLPVRDGKTGKPRRHRIEVDGLSSFGEDLEGELYLVAHSGTIYRLAAR